MAQSFGTSGFCGLVKELTPALLAEQVRAFIAVCDVGDAVFVGRDLRPSSLNTAACVLDVIRGEGLTAVDCRAVPATVLALAAMQAGARGSDDYR